MLLAASTRSASQVPSRYLPQDHIRDNSPFTLEPLDADPFSTRPWQHSMLNALADTLTQPPGIQSSVPSDNARRLIPGQAPNVPSTYRDQDLAAARTRPEHLQGWGFAGPAQGTPASSRASFQDSSALGNRPAFPSPRAPPAQTGLQPNNFAPNNKQTTPALPNDVDAGSSNFPRSLDTYRATPAPEKDVAGSSSGFPGSFHPSIFSNKPSANPEPSSRQGALDELVEIDPSNFFTVNGRWYQRPAM
ncbi:hypothetical protein BOTBODRAFT_37669 [Botryobasidium botryosum FD-172 SS1]|uniref:Uncharacterized protein n=1 Tax=Botryobasidium botryosum (strain FD-172 SS1) TaxID=930990 RepID=A0A067MB71_BOTB1|nr:hypothetical protein BOTBODRAFT_37669 [Botryobasidium botryosum FD-172 SS1]